MITMDAAQLRAKIDQQLQVESAIFADLDWSDFDCEGGAFTGCRFVEASATRASCPSPSQPAESHPAQAARFS